jgi:hypothetical protein
MDRRGICSQGISFYWSDVQYTPLVYPSIGQIWSIFPLHTLLLVTRTLSAQRTTKLASVFFFLWNSSTLSLQFWKYDRTTPHCHFNTICKQANTLVSWFTLIHPTGAWYRRQVKWQVFYARLYIMRDISSEWQLLYLFVNCMCIVWCSGMHIVTPILMFVMLAGNSKSCLLWSGKDRSFDGVGASLGAWPAQGKPHSWLTSVCIRYAIVVHSLRNRYAIVTLCVPYAFDRKHD